MPSVTEVVDGYLAELAPLDPHAARALRPDEPVTMVPDLSPEAFAARADTARRALARLAAATCAAGERALSAAFAERLASDVALYDSGFTTRLLAPLATPVHTVRGVFDNLPRGGDADWARVREHLALVPAALRQYEATLRAAAGAGNVAPRRQVLAVAAQCAAWTGADRFYPRLVAGYRGADGRLRDRLERAAAAAGEATERFAGFLRTDLAPLAAERDGVGEEVYQLTARCFLGADVDLDDTYEFGWAELDRLDERIRQVAGGIVAGGGLDEAAAHLDGRGVLHGAAALREWLQRRADELVEALDGPHFELPPPGRRVECHITPATSGIMYYSPGSPDFTVPGRVWWCLPEGTTSAPTWQQVSALHHEALPGHHLQHAVALGTADLHVWQRALAHVHGYAEGWAHYAEGLADELGLLRDDGERLGMLCAQAWRAARVVVDLGLHRGLRIRRGPDAGRPWTPERAEAMLTAVARVDPATARFEVTRYLGWPGQALAFKVGERLWLAAREDARRRARAAGVPFDLRQFHMRALRLGPMGLGPLRAVLGDDRAVTG